jgi:hypothetical protein
VVARVPHPICLIPYLYPDHAARNSASRNMVGWTRPAVEGLGSSPVGNAGFMEHIDETTAPPPTEVDVSLPASIDGLRRVAIATDESDEQLARVRRAVLGLARTHGFDVVLYDRSHERWTDHPHPKGPVIADELQGTDREHLVRQLRDFEREGVTASAWLATLPALTAMLDVLQSLELDAVMLPEHLDEPTLMDRVQVGDTPAAMVRRIAELNMKRPPLVLVVPESGAIAVVE